MTSIDMIEEKKMDSQKAFAYSCFEKIEERMERVVNSNYEENAIRVAKNIVKKVFIRSQWVEPGTEFQLGEYSLLIADENLTEWTPIVYITGFVLPDGSLQISLEDEDYPRMFYEPQLETDESDDDLTRYWTTKIMPREELELSVEQRARTLKNFAYLFKYGDKTPLELSKELSK